MEKVLVVKEVPGMLKVGDILVADLNGDFYLTEDNANVSRYVNIDYVTVSDNIPEYFDYVLDMKESECQDCHDCDYCLCEECFGIEKSIEEVLERRDFFQKQLDKSISGSEAEVVFTNLIWFIEWLLGKRSLLK
jgi:hypothetical protein